MDQWIHTVQSPPHRATGYDTSPAEKARKYLGRFGLHGDLALQPVKFLSGGQKSRLAFAELAWWGGPREAQWEAQGRPKGGPRPKRAKEVSLGQQGKRPKFHPRFKSQSKEMSISSTMFHGIPALRQIQTWLFDDKELTSHHASG